ncbi:MAG: hypothetical protein K0B15_14690 [Lentimicrobium sp.]|nr:hypothetical protein [Lentimicrobium sp.]
MLTSHVDIEVLVDAKQKFELNIFTQSPARDFIDMVNTNSHLVLYGKPSETDYRLLSAMLAGRGDSSIKHANEISCASIIPDQQNPFQLFFADQGDFLKETDSGFFTASIDNYEERFKELIKEPFFRLGDPESDSKFNSWKDLDSGVFVSDVILVDTYAVNTADENILENNLYSLARLFKSKDTLRSFLVFTRIPNRKDKDKNIPLNRIVQKLREILGTQVATGVIYFEKFSNEHDRHMIMNYQYINSGNSFSSVYDAHGLVKTKNASTISIHPLTDHVNFRKTKDILSLMQKALIAHHEKIPGGHDITSRLFYCLEK